MLRANLKTDPDDRLAQAMYREDVQTAPCDRYHSQRRRQEAYLPSK